ncbi:MAG: hypothetical protein QM737_03230 [Ferruginibacter sp.]
MIEINTVKEKYASMPDSELIDLAQNEAQQLTEDGLRLLSDELARRNLNPDIIENTVSAKSNDNTNNYDQFTTSYWTFVFDEKENGKPDPEIIAGLLEAGMEESSAMELVAKMEAAAKQQLKKADSEKLIGGAILMGGIAITFLPLSMPANRLTYIIAWCAILLGTLKFIKGLYYRNRFRKIIKTIMAEKNQ